MKSFSWRTCLLVAALTACLTGFAQAGRTPSLRTPEYRNYGARNNIRVPYLTSGSDPYMQGAVEPLMYASPIVDDPAHPQAKPVFNIIFYGAHQAFGDQSNGAAPKPR